VAYVNKGAERTVFAFGPEANRAIFGDTDTYHIFGPPGPRNSSQRRFQQGLFGLNGAKHLEHRRMLMPALRKEVVLAQAGAMARLVEGYLDRFRPGQDIDLYAAMKELALLLACKLLFGLDEIPRARELADTFQVWLDGYISSLFEMVLPVHSPPGSYERMLATGIQLEGHFRQLIEQWQPTSGEGHGNMLGMLLQARQAGRIGDAEVIGEMQTLLNASYQTTGSALTWTLLLLAQHPDALRQLNDELQTGAAEQSIYLDCVIKESLRILPPVVFTARRMTRADTLAGQPLPEGTIVLPSIYVTHHLADLFPEPERFLPARWLGKSVSPYAYLPFSVGPRMCMGTAFSLQLLKIVVPAVVKRFRIALQPGTRVDRHSNLTLGVHGSLPVTLLAQDGRFQAAALTGNIHEMVQMPQETPLRRAA
jgi:cytochrome P450